MRSINKNIKKRNNIKSDVETEVMSQIFALEKRRTVVFLLKYLLLIGTFIVLIILYTILAISMMNESQTFDLLTLFTQDYSTVRGYVLDTLYIFFLEMPKEEIAIAVISLILIVVTLYLFKKQLPTLLHKFQSIKKFSNRYR